MKTILVGFAIAVFAQSAIVGQEAPAFPASQKEHAWLQQFVGEWTVTSEAVMTPGQPPIQCKGTMRSRMLGEFWVVSEMKNEMLGTSMTAIQSIGYDPLVKKYVGTFIDSMQGHMWKYEGTVDPTDKILTLEADGPNFMQAGKMSKYRDVYQFKSKNHILMSSLMQGDDEKWVTFMRGDIKRDK